MSKRIVLLQALASTPKDLQLLLGKMAETAVHQRPADDEWSVAEVLCHLIDTEHRFRQRLRRIVREDNPTLPYIHPDESRYQPQASLENMLWQFEQARGETVAFLQDLSMGQWQRPAVHETLGETKLRYLVQMLVDHDINHMNQAVEIHQKLRQQPPRDPQPATGD